MKIENKKIYLCGAISGNKSYLDDFFNAEFAVEKFTQKILNPARLPEGLSYAEYMDICTAMVRVADVIVVVNNIENSAGANAEIALAKCLGKIIIKGTNFIN